MLGAEALRMIDLLRMSTVHRRVLGQEIKELLRVEFAKGLRFRKDEMTDLPIDMIAIGVGTLQQILVIQVLEVAHANHERHVEGLSNRLWSLHRFVLSGESG